MRRRSVLKSAQLSGQMASVVAARRAPCAAATRRQPIAAGGLRGRGPRAGRRAAGLDARRVRRGPAQAEEVRAAAARCGEYWSATASASKKSLQAAEQDRADVARARRRWIRQQGLLDASSLVFIDETSVNTSMARLYGRCPRGERLIGRVPFGTWETLTFVAGLRCDEMTAPLVIEGAMNGEIFLSYVEQYLAPALNHGDIVVMDNLRAHKVAGVEEAIEALGAGDCYICPSTRPISIPSRCPSASSRRICAKLPSGRSAAFAAELASSCLASAQTNAPTTSLMPDMFQYERNPL